MSRYLALVGLILLVSGCEESSEHFLKRYAKEQKAVTVGGFASNGHRDVLAVEIKGSQRAWREVSPHLANLTKLNRLAIDGIELSAEDFKTISVLPITTLELWHCKFTDEALNKLETIQNLKVLRIGSADFSDSALEQLRNIASIEELHVGGPNVNGVAFDRRGFERLERLFLGGAGSPINDESLKSISKLKSLKELGIHHTDVTGIGLLELSKIHSLERVHCPDGISIADAVAARKLHIEEKQKARDAGISVPADELSPFSEYENLIDEPGFGRREDMLNSQDALKNAPRNGIELKKWPGKW